MMMMMMAAAEPTSNHNEAIDLSLIKKEISDDPKMNGDSSNNEKLLFASMFEQQVMLKALNGWWECALCR